MNSLIKIGILCLLLSSSCIQISFTKSYKKLNNEIQNENPNSLPDENTAIKVAEVILISKYGDQIKLNRPFEIKLQNDSIWIIKGIRNKRMMGGVPFIELRKKDCAVLKIGHTR